MNIKNLAVSALMALSLSGATGAFAQEATEDAATSASPTPNNWLKICEPLESGEQACIMRQVVMQSGNFVGSFLLRDDPGQESRLLAIAAVPLGVLLPFGLTWQIDGSQPVRVPFMMCDPQACSTQLVINEAYVNSLKRGAVLKLTAKNRQNQDFVVEINLAGFTSAYDAESAQSFEDFNQNSSGTNALEQMLQDRAEELRRELGVEGEATTTE